MTPEQRIDANIRAILQAWSSDGDKTIAQENMREAMRRIMSESYIKGSNNCLTCATPRVISLANE